MLGAMFSGRHNTTKNEDGAYFIDRDGTHFRHILNFLRSPEEFDTTHLSPVQVKEIRIEARFYALEDFMFPPQPVVAFVPAPLCKASARIQKATNGELGNVYDIYINQGADGIFMSSIYPNSPPENTKVITICLGCQTGIVSMGNPFTIRGLGNSIEYLEVQPTRLTCVLCC